MNDLLKWQHWFERGLDFPELVLYQRRREAMLVMGWIFAHADNMGTGWGFGDSHSLTAFGHEVGLTGDEFEDGLKILLDYDLIRSSPSKYRHPDYSVNLSDEKFWDLIP